MRLLDYELKWDNPSSNYPLFTGTFEFEGSEEVLLVEEYMKKYAKYFYGIRPHFYAGDYPRFKREMPSLKEVIFNDPATICIWSDGSKTVVKCEEGDTFDKEKGIALCFMKKINNNKGNYNNVFKKFIKEESEDEK